MKRLRSIFVAGNLIVMLLSACSAGYSNAESRANEYGNRNGEPGPLWLQARNRTAARNRGAALKIRPSPPNSRRRPFCL